MYPLSPLQKEWWYSISMQRLHRNPNSHPFWMLAIHQSQAPHCRSKSEWVTLGTWKGLKALAHFASTSKATRAALKLRINKKSQKMPQVPALCSKADMLRIQATPKGSSGNWAGRQRRPCTRFTRHHREGKEDGLRRREGRKEGGRTNLNLATQGIRPELGLTGQQLALQRFLFSFLISFSMWKYHPFGNWKIAYNNTQPANSSGNCRGLMV